jgi:hypothetical protein
MAILASKSKPAMHFRPNTAMKRILTSTILLGLAAIVAPNALAQQAQIKPGLWQVEQMPPTESQSNPLGDSIQQWADSVATPETRREIAEADAALSVKGRETTGSRLGLRTKECITKEQIARYDILGEQTLKSCSTQKSPRPDGVDVSMTCTDPDMRMTMDMRVRYRGEKAFDIESVTTMLGIDNQPMILKGSGSGKWLSSDCGDIKPRSASQ